MDTITYYFYYLEAIYTGFPLVVKIALWLIVAMLGLYIISWITIGRSFFNRTREARRRKSILKVVENMDEILFSKEDLAADEIRERLEIGSPVKKWKKVYLSELLVEEMQDKGINETNLAQLFHILQLPDFWENQMESRDAEKRWKAIRMLDSMSPYVMASVISKHAAVEGKELGKYAKSVFSKFESHDAFKFLEEDFGGNLRELDKIRIHNALKTRRAEEVLPHLLRIALTTTKDDYRVFLIREIKFLNRSENLDSLLELYQQTNSAEVKAAIVDTLSTLKYQGAQKVFIQDYPFNKSIVQFEIIEAMGKMGGSEAIEFLEKIYYQTNNKEMLIRILHNMYIIDSSEFSVFNRLKKQNQNSFNSSIFTFVEKKHAFA